MQSHIEAHCSYHSPLLRVPGREPDQVCFDGGYDGTIRPRSYHLSAESRTPPLAQSRARRAPCRRRRSRPARRENVRGFSACEYQEKQWRSSHGEIVCELRKTHQTICGLVARLRSSVSLNSMSASDRSSIRSQAGLFTPSSLRTEAAQKCMKITSSRWPRTTISSSCR